MTAKTNHVHIGSSFDAYLTEEGILEETEDMALKEIIVDQIRAAMQEKAISKTAMAERMKTSRRQLDRLLDGSSPSVTLLTLRKAASVLGRKLVVELR